MDIPIIKNIHQEILKAVNDGANLNMNEWHTCDTTHCRAGWAVHLAGEKGKKLESETSTLFAAMQILKKSSDIHVPLMKFFDNNTESIKDIKRCAELEATNAKTK